LIDKGERSRETPKQPFAATGIVVVGQIATNIPTERVNIADTVTPLKLKPTAGSIATKEGSPAPKLAIVIQTVNPALGFDSVSGTRESKRG
jgi:hypothetical protein